MRDSWWYGVGASAIVWLLGTVTVGTVPGDGAFGSLINTELVFGMLLTWLAMPLFVFLDQRSNSDSLAWEPTTSLWVLGSLVWFVNIGVGTVYCLRRYVAAGRTAPSRRWTTVIAVSGVIWAVATIVDQVAGPFTKGVEAVLALPVILAWIGIPAGILIDAVRVRGLSDWDPDSRIWALAAAIPFVNVAIGGLYLYKRRVAFRPVDTSGAFTMPDANGETRTETAVDGSPWFRRAGALFCLYFLVLVVLVVVGPSVSDTAIQLFGLVLWIPFGPFFTACVYKDAAWRRERDRSVGRTWWIYLLSGLVQGIAFWYLVRRALKSDGYRRRNCSEPGVGPD